MTQLTIQTSDIELVAALSELLTSYSKRLEKVKNDPKKFLEEVGSQLIEKSELIAKVDRLVGIDHVGANAENGVFEEQPSVVPAVPQETLDTSAAGTLADIVTDSPQIDSAGNVWDATLHSAGKTKTADGQWRRIKKSSLSGVLKKYSEHKVVAKLDEAAKLTPSVVPVAPEIPVETFHTLMPKITQKISAGALTHAQVADVVKSVGLNILQDLILKPELASSVALALGV